MRNPLKNGQIISKGDSRGYVGQNGIQRGDPLFVMSRSELVEFAVCPSRWISGGYASKDTSATEWGSLVDCILFEPNAFDDRYAIKPEAYPAEGKKGEPIVNKPWNGNSSWCKEWLANCSGVPISNDLHVEASRAANRLKSDSIAKEILREASYQVHVRAEYHDADTELVIPVKALIDIVPTGNYADELDDFKTARDANPSAWGRVCFQRGYHVQAALHLDAYNAATNENRQVFGHVVQENEPPYEVSTPQLSVEMVNLGRAQYKAALALYAQCLKTNAWPSYNDLSANAYKGRPLIEPESWMMMAQPINDPDWMSDKKEAA